MHPVVQCKGAHAGNVVLVAKLVAYVVPKFAGPARCASAKEAHP